MNGPKALNSCKKSPCSHSMPVQRGAASAQSNDQRLVPGDEVLPRSVVGSWRCRMATKRSSKRLLNFIAVPLLLASLAACTTNFQADVKRFSQLPAPQGQTFAVVPGDAALEGGLEFAHYAKLVEAYMAQQGYTLADPEHATLLVSFNYGVDNGREKIRSYGYADPFYGPWYGYGGLGYYGRHWGPYGGWGYGWYDPWFDGGVESYTVYTSGIDLKIDRKADGLRVFEGKAEAVSSSNHLQYLVPNLIQAMFTNFPGQSGETIRITIAPEKQTTKETTKEKTSY
jgi:hypothetical protein